MRYVMPLGQHLRLCFRMGAQDVDDHRSILLRNLRTRRSNRTTRSPHRLQRRLGATDAPVVAPRLNLICYHGILAPSARDRAQIVPGAENGRAPSCACTPVTLPPKPGRQAVIAVCRRPHPTAP